MKLQFSKEVEAARRDGTPLVALETSFLAQSLPYPQNLEAVRRCEAAIRQNGAVPAAMAMIEGTPWCGLEWAQLEQIARGKGLHKIDARDLAISAAQKVTGGTTVSATCHMSAAAGITVFSTGGLGGVHRGLAEDLDISQDLPAISRAPVAVVCAGAKSVLDLPKTLEMLETLGVPVIGVGTNEMPGFYSRESGLTLEHSVRDANEAGAVLRARREFGQGGMIFAVPPPEEFAIAHGEIEEHVEAALADARKENIGGKRVTAYLLAELVRRTAGRSLKAHVALLENNAAFAAQLAKAYASPR